MPSTVVATASGPAFPLPPPLGIPAPGPTNDAPYAPQSEGGVIWNDPDLAIPWPVDGEPLLSAKDQVLPRVKDLGAVSFS